MESKRSFDPRNYMGISQDRLVALALWLLTLDGKRGSFENLVAEAFESFPERFMFEGYRHWPNAHRPALWAGTEVSDPGCQHSLSLLREIVSHFRQDIPSRRAAPALPPWRVFLVPTVAQRVTLPDRLFAGKRPRRTPQQRLRHCLSDQSPNPSQGQIADRKIDGRQGIGSRAAVCGDRRNS
jgi:hypothetical protein